MSLFGKILKTGFDVVTSPVEVIKDCATMGGLLSDDPCGHKGPYTLRRLKKLGEDAEEVREEIDDL